MNQFNIIIKLNSKIINNEIANSFKIKQNIHNKTFLNEKNNVNIR